MPGEPQDKIALNDEIMDECNRKYSDFLSELDNNQDNS
jgi:hypothetical protein